MPLSAFSRVLRPAATCRRPAPRPAPSAAAALVGAIVLAIALLLAACGPGAGKTAAGVVIALDAQAGRVTGFSLRTTSGETLVFRVGDLETDQGTFPAAHLSEHAVSFAPIAVAYREDDGALVAYRLADAPWAVPSG